MRQLVGLVAGLLTLVFAAFGHAQSIRVSVIDAANVEHAVGWFDYGQDVRIDLADINNTYQQFKFIRVMDTASPRGDISRVSLYCSEVTTIPEVKVLLGSMGDTTFPTSYLTSLPTAGCRNLGLPLTPGSPDDAFVVEGSVPEGTTVILAAAIGGDLTGKITTGQVFRLQVTGGVIADDVQAKWPSAHPDSDVHPERTYTIERIEAKSITGRIIAGDEVGPPTNMAPQPCSIRDIVAGDAVHTAAHGIHANILAYGGHIRHIESTGHIGTAEDPIHIRSGFGLAELSCTATVIGQPAPRASDLLP